MARRPPRKVNLYNQQLDGVYGVFGSGTGLQAFYLQAAITPSDLERVSLISDIKGSERWPVRDLFQRDVDNKRIETSLLPYLETMDRIKFFNPLTLTVLPMSNDGHTVLSKMPAIVERVEEEDGETWRTLERKGFYVVQWVEETEQYARLKWSDRRARLVAIDGQHRLSALKRFLVDHEAGAAHDDFMTWRIPVIVVSFRALDQAEPPSVLEVVRSIFIYINTQAHEVNEARNILLSDESVNHVCTQELIQNSHENDLLQATKRDPDTLPLLFYDWRGEERDQRRVAAPAAVKTVEEIRDWFRQYILGTDFSADQQAALGITPTHPLHAVFGQRSLSYKDASRVRSHFREELLPALSRLLQHFSPYKSYVQELRRLETSYMEGDARELASHAFTKLRFGNSHAPDSVKRDVDDVLVRVEDDIGRLKEEHFGGLMGLDVGMRGVVCAFGSLAGSFGYPDWLDYSAWFTSALNEVYQGGWLSGSGRRSQFLHHVSIDHNEAVVNYRLDDAHNALGAYVALLVGTYGSPIPRGWKVDWIPLKEIHVERLFDTVNRGFRKEVRVLLKPEYPDGGRPLTDAVKREAEKRTGRQMRRFEKELGKLEEEKG